MPSEFQRVVFREWPALLILLVCVLGCGKLSSLTSGDRVPEEIKKNADDALKANVLADPPSPGASVVRQMARLDPKAAEFEKIIEDLERKALKEFIADIAKKNDLEAPKAMAGGIGPMDRGTRLPILAFAGADPTVLAMFQGPNTTAPKVGVNPNDVNLIVAFISVLASYVGPALDKKGELKVDHTVNNGGSVTNMNVEIAKGDAGATKFGFKMNTRGVNGNRTLDSDLEGMVEGVRCPDVNGSVYFNVSVKLSGKNGDNTYIQDVKAKVMAQTNDEADTASYEMRINQGIQETVGGRNSYLESEFEVTDSTATPPRIVRQSQDTGPHADELGKSGFLAGMQAGQTALKLAEAMWQNGGCVAIQANSPGSVQPSSVTEIPVDVKHRYEGGPVPSKVKAELSGETSVSPTLIAQTPGRLSYTAPAEKNKSAVIKLEARTKRGRAKLDLNATTGGNAYRISGSLDEASQSGTVCDSSQPFSIGGTLQFKFTPTSPTMGTYTYSGPYSAKGSGPYVINEDGTMKLDGTGCIMGGGCATYSHKWTAEPIDPSTCQ